MLAAKHRLRSKKTIDAVFKNGRTVFSDWLFAKFMPNDQEESRFAFSIGLKFSKKAVDRNRAKRLLRQAVSLQTEKIKPGYDFVFFLKNVKPENLDLAAVNQNLINLLKRTRLM